MSIAGKVVVVTGATSGLGQAAAIEFARRGAEVVVVGRDAARADETAQRIRDGGGQAHVVLGDVSTRAGVDAIAAGVRSAVPRVDVLLNNAGGQFLRHGTTSEGVERTLALNTLGAYRLERALHDLVARGRGRVVNVATGFLDRFPIPSIEELRAPTRYAGMTQYGRAKLATVMLTVEQARAAADGVAYASVHPGIVNGTRFTAEMPKAMQAVGAFVSNLVGIASPIEVAGERFRVACFDDVPSGAYVLRGAVARLPKQADDAAVRAQVMRLLVDLDGAREDVAAAA